MPALAGLTALALWLRIRLLGAPPLTYDEGFSWALARMPWRDFAELVWRYEGNMAIYYLLLRPWSALGESEYALRSLSAVLGAATIPAIYMLGRRLFGTAAGLSAAALLAVHQHHIHASQDARAYALQVLLLTIAAYFFVRALEIPGDKRLWAAHALAGALAVYCHVFSLLVVAAMWLSPGVAGLRAVGWRRAAWAAAPLALLALPMCLYVVRSDAGQLDWMPQLSPARLAGLGLALTGGGGPFLMALYLAAALTALRRGGARGARLPAAWLVLPVALMLAVSLHKPLLSARYFHMCVPALVLLAAYGVSRLGRAFPAGLAALMLLSSLGLAGHYARRRAAPHEWREVARYVVAGQRPGDRVYFYPWGSRFVFSYYAGREGGGPFLAEEANFFEGRLPPTYGPLDPDVYREGVGRASAAGARAWFVSPDSYALSPYPTKDREQRGLEAARAAWRERYILRDKRLFPSPGADALAAELYLPDQAAGGGRSQ